MALALVKTAFIGEVGSMVTKASIPGSIGESSGSMGIARSSATSLCQATLSSTSSAVSLQAVG